MGNKNFDFVVIGAGIVGLTIARELSSRYSGKRIAIVEKESMIGKHSSGRNSGVLHSGIFYPAQSLKAKVCSSGAQQLSAYCTQAGLPINKIGEVILPTREEDDQQIDVLLERGATNGVTVELIDRQQLAELEPEAYSATGRALWLANISVIDSMAILNHLVTELKVQGVVFYLGENMMQIDPAERSVSLSSVTLLYGHLINSAGLHADRLAEKFSIGKQYTFLPFKGIYYKLSPSSGLHIRHLIYPVPDLRVPFLGVHYTTAINGQVYLGPTAIPVFGRENYSGFQGVNLQDTSSIIYRLIKQYMANHQGFRLLTKNEGRCFFKKNFVEAARVLTPRLKSEHLLTCGKVGIRPQLVDMEKNELVMDFVVEKGKNSTHILNAISPAFTSSFAFAEHVVTNYIEKREN
ncbi:MAG: L-2-hydroxyglutarate oxidase [Actinobacteria bacterium]|nr:L-2-hydroxyglutarate oxidase [Actinomycetota bacterium]